MSRSYFGADSHFIYLKLAKFSDSTPRIPVAQQVNFWPVDLAVPFSRLAGAGNLSNRKKDFNCTEPFSIILPSS